MKCIITCILLFLCIFCKAQSPYVDNGRFVFPLPINLNNVTEYQIPFNSGPASPSTIIGDSTFTFGQAPNTGVKTLVVGSHSSTSNYTNISAGQIKIGASSNAPYTEIINQGVILASNPGDIGIITLRSMPISQNNNYLVYVPMVQDSLDYIGDTLSNRPTAKVTQHQLATSLRPTYAYFQPHVGDNQVLTDNAYNIIDPIGDLLNLTISLPSSPLDGDYVEIKIIDDITTATWTGGTIAPSLLRAGSPLLSPTAGFYLKLTYVASKNTWY
jgi:hypothetical protein